MTHHPSQPAWPQLGAFSYEFTTSDNLITAFKAAGLTAVQLGAPILNEVLGQPERAAELRAQLADHNISIVALAGYRNIVTPNAQQRHANLTFLARCLEIAPHLGRPIVATETGTCNRENEWAYSPENQSAEAWDVLRATLRELLPVAEHHGSILALEGYINNVVNTLDRMEALLTEFPSPHLQLVLDPYNYLSSDLLSIREQIAQEFFRRFKDRFVVAHLKDVCSEGAEVNTPEFGTGIFPQQLYIEFLRTERPDLPLILEHLPWDHIPQATQHFQQLAL